MAKKRKVKPRHNELRIKIYPGPGGLPKITPLQFWKGLRRHRQEGWELPETWDVLIDWKNPDIESRPDWRGPGEFMTALSDSGVGFGVLVDQIIEKNIRRYER